MTGGDAPESWLKLVEEAESQRAAREEAQAAFEEAQARAEAGEFEGEDGDGEELPEADSL